MSVSPLHDITIGTLAPAGPNTAEYLSQIVDYGFESFELTFWRKIDGINLKALARDVHKALDGTGAVISSIGVYGNPLGDEAEDAETRKAWRSLIDNAHHFGAGVVCGFAGRVRHKPIPDSMKTFAKVFGPLAKRAEDKGVKIAFENCDMGGNWNTGDWNIAHNPTAWEMMFDAVPSEALGLEWEPCHQMVNLIDPIPQLRKWAKRIHHVHGKDATVMWDVVSEYGIGGVRPFAYHRTPGFGDTNWADVISELRLQGFKGAIDIEGWHDPVYREELEMTGQVHALDYLKACRGGHDFIQNPKVG